MKHHALDRIIEPSVYEAHWDYSSAHKEFEKATNAFADIGPAISIFGSARLKSDSPYYQLAEQLAEQLSLQGFSIISGGGPGIMEAANKGAIKGQGHSIGLNIVLPREQSPNSYQNISLHYHYFFSRKMGFIEHSAAFICMPGGVGTLDELFEVLTLCQTKKIKPVPIILVGSVFWAPLIAWFEDTLVAEGLVSIEDLELFQVLDHSTEILAALKASLA